MAEVILPGEEETNVPEIPGIVLEMPGINSKVIKVSFDALNTRKTTIVNTSESFFTTDTDAWLEFTVTGLTDATGTYSLVLRNRDDGSTFQRVGNTVDGKAYYKIPEQEIRHAGRWIGQMYVTLENGQTTAAQFSFRVDGHILDGKDVRETVVEDFQTLMAQLQGVKGQAKIDLADLKADLSLSAVEAEQLIADTQELKLIYDELLETGVLQTNINKKLTELETTYAPRLTTNEQSVVSLTAQLAQTADGQLVDANGLNKISFQNYLGNDQNIHPKVLYFKNGWNGYKYWMGYTPYPYGRTHEENPSIAVSNNRYHWETPEGLENPLDDYPGGGSEGGTNSDTHLVYRKDLDRLELWWRTYNNPVHFSILYRRTTTDGINWTQKEIMYTSSEHGDFISPAIIFEDGKYKTWSVTGGTNFRVQYSEKIDGGTTWSKPIDLDIDYGEVNPWHIDVIATDKGYEMVVSERGNTGRSRDFFYILQRHDGTITKPKRMMSVNRDNEAIDGGKLYRASLLKEENMYYLYYSSESGHVGQNRVWGMSLSHGRNPLNLKGTTIPKRVVELEPGQVLEDYNVYHVDTFILPNVVNSEVIFKSFVNGYPGQEIRVIANSQKTSKAIFEPSTYIWTPNMEETILDTSQRIATLHGTQVDDGRVRFNLAVSGQRKTEEKGFVMLKGNEVLTDYDVSKVSTFIIPQTVQGVGVTFNSFANAELGQVIHVVLRNSTSVATFVNSSYIYTPNREDYTITQADVAGATLVCSQVVDPNVRFSVF